MKTLGLKALGLQLRNKILFWECRVLQPKIPAKVDIATEVNFGSLQKIQNSCNQERLLTFFQHHNNI